MQRSILLVNLLVAFSASAGAIEPTRTPASPAEISEANARAFAVNLTANWFQLNYKEGLYATFGRLEVKSVKKTGDGFEIVVSNSVDDAAGSKGVCTKKVVLANRAASIDGGACIE